MPPLFPLTLALYAVSGTLYLAHLTAANRLLARAARIVLGLAFLSQAGATSAGCARTACIRWSTHARRCFSSRG